MPFYEIRVLLQLLKRDPILSHANLYHNELNALPNALMPCLWRRRLPPAPGTAYRLPTDQPSDSIYVL
jgi:hypothetical protein